MCSLSFLNDFAMRLNSIYKEIKMIPDCNYDCVSPNNRFQAAEG